MEEDIRFLDFCKYHQADTIEKVVEHLKERG